eukprot:gene8747-14770_t
MNRPLLKRTSSISQRVDQERNDVPPSINLEESKSAKENARDDGRARVEQSFEQEDDTDMSNASDSDTEEQATNQQSEEKQAQRASSRIMSIKRRGKLERYKSMKFLYVANDYLAIRGQGYDFYLCRVLEDVPENKESFQIAWLDQVGEKKQVFKTSYDDICYKESVIDRVNLTEGGDGMLHLGKKHLKQVKDLLREALQNENANLPATETSDDEDDGDSVEDLEDKEEEEKEESDDGPSPKKRRKRAAKPTENDNKSKIKKLKEKKAKIVKRRGLMPNQDIKIVEKDPLFEEKNDLPIANVKRGVRAVLLNDMQMLKEAIDDVENVYTVFWDRSADIHLGPLHYALLTENKMAVDLLRNDKQPKERKAKRPAVSLEKMNTGRYNFYTFGHAVREVQASRGAKEGNNAFLKERDYQDDVSERFCLKYVTTEMTEYYYNKQDNQYSLMTELGSAIRNGRRSIAAHFLNKHAEKEDLTSYGFNFLHKEDSKGRKLIHYAAACEGPGPLAFLISRGADPNDVDSKGTTPLMIAAKLGRCANVEELLKVKIEIEFKDQDDAEDDEVDKEMDDNEDPLPSSKGMATCININAKGKRTTKAPIHYAAKNGHESTVRLLVEQGANIDLQTGASKGNMTALALAAERGHLKIVKTLIELGAAPDGKVKHNKRPLMLAAQNGHYKVMAYLLNIGVDPNAQDSSLNTPIHYAAAYGWYHCVNLLLKAGADPNIGNIWKTTPLAIALLKDNMHCADLLLDSNVNVDFPDEKGATILMSQLALDFEDGSFEKIRFLVEEKGADVNNKDMNGSSPATNRKDVTFDKASSDICNEIARILIKAGADLNCLNEDGYTPALTALLQNNFPLVELLLQNGADVNTMRDGSTLKPMLHVLLSKTECLDLIEMFDDRSKHENIDDLTGDQIEKIYEEQNAEVKEAFFKLFMKCGADVNAVAEDGTTPVMLAIQQGFVKKSETFLSNGADPRIGKNSFGQNTFHILASSCTSADWSKLMSLAVDKFGPMSDLINEADNDGYTPVLLAFEALATSACKEDAVHNFKAFIKFLAYKCNPDFSANVIQKKVFSKKESEESEKSEESKESEDPEESEESEGSEKSEESEEYEDPEESEETEESVKKYRSIPTFGFKIEKDKKIENDPYSITGKFTCLHFLAMVHLGADDQADCVDMIMKTVNGQLLNAKCRHGRTPLHIAIKFRNYHAAVCFINAGCDISIKSSNSEEDCLLGPIALASRPPCQLDVVKELIKFKADPNVRSGKDERTPLSFAVENVSDKTYVGAVALELVKTLVAAGAIVNSCDVNRRTPLHHLINSSSGGYEALTEVEEFFISSDADVTATDCKQKMPIFYAFSNFNSKQKDETSMIDPISIVRLICDHAETKSVHTSVLSHKDNRQRTVMHYAALRGASISCLHMLKHGALANGVDEDGNTPVALALRSGHHGCAMILLQHSSKLSTWDVITPVTEEQLKEYKEEVASSRWKHAANCALQKPEPVKKSALQIAIEKDWPGVAYMILECGGIPLFDAFRASLKASRLSLAWTLLKQERNAKAFLALDGNSSSMLHVLATHSNLDESDDGMLIQIAKFLLDKGIDVAKEDKDGVLPLHIAAHNAHFSLCSLFLDYSLVSLNRSNKEGLTPLAAVFNTAVNDGKIEEKHVKLIKLFVSKGVNSFDICYSTGTLDNEALAETTTILNDLVLLENDGNFADPKSSDKQGSIEYLLANGADINFANRRGITPLMVAVMSNYQDMVKLLLSYRQINLDVVTKNGSSLAHICLSSKDGFYTEHTEILKILLKKRIGLEHVDDFGHAPLYYALKQPTGVMASLFPARLKQNFTVESVKEEEVFPFKSKAGEFWEGTKLDVKRDAEEEIKKLKKVQLNESTPTVDKALNMAATGAVYMDEETGVFYDVVLTKVDVRRGLYGINVFYKLQVVHHKGKQLWLLFNRWGRIGSGGQHQQTPFSNPQDACNEFQKIFKSKTGNKWADLNNFQKTPNKYSLIDLRAYDRWLQNFCKVDRDFLPFGLISRDVIEQAKLILNEIRGLLESKKVSQANDVFIYEKVAELSNNLYMMVPPAHYAYERIIPLNTLNEVKKYLERLNMLTDLSTASELLLAAQHKKQVINPVDYVFRGIGVNCEIMDHTSTESQYILQFIENSLQGETVKVSGLYRLKRDEEENNFESCGVKHNRQLLWHGTDTSHVISILKNGIKQDEIHSMKTGNSLGCGIYFSLSFKKAMSYSSYHNNCKSPGFVFLCEVALGDMQVAARNCWSNSQNEDDTDTGSAKYHSRALGCSVMPDPTQDVFTPYGAKLCVGRWKENPDGEDYWRYNEHECLVQDHRQIKLRYLVMIR